MSEILTADQQSIETLKRFYGVTTLEQLVLIQAHHIERLQAKIPDRPDYSGRKVREG